MFHGELDKEIYELFYANTGTEYTGTIIEAGAADGIRLTNSKFFEDELGWNVILLEPHPNSYKQLIENRPNSVCLNYALSNCRNTVAFNLERDPVRSHFGSKMNRRHRGSVEVKTIVYDDIFAHVEVDHVDVMILDVESHEPEVLKGMIGTHLWPDVFCIEMCHLEKKV